MSHFEYFYTRLDMSESYLEDEQLRLGTFLDLGVNQCGLSGQRCIEIFVESGLSVAFERQLPKYVSGMSGAELLACAFERCGIEVSVPNESRCPTSADYWVGYTLPCFQMATGCTYKQLFEVLTYDDIRGLHYRLQDREESEFVASVQELLKARKGESKLRSLRRAYGYTQAELAELSGVSLRSIQLYEQGEKDINRAAADTVRRLSQVLRCSMEDVMELPR